MAAVTKVSSDHQSHDQDLHNADYSNQISLRDQLANKKFHEKVDFILHRPIVEYCIIILIVADSLIVVASLMLEIKIIEVTVENMETDKTIKSTSVHDLERTAEILHYTSLAILTLFLIEVFLKLYSQREKFFKRKIQVLDSFIVAISFALDIAVIAIQGIDPATMNGLSLIILLRLWRVVRIVNGAVVATKTELEEKIHHFRNEVQVSREEIGNLQALLDEKDQEVTFLKERLAKYEPIDMVPTGTTKLPPYLPETKKFPSHVLGDATDDEDFHASAFTDLNQINHSKKAIVPSSSQHGTAFQAYQAGVTYQPTSQFPADQRRPHTTSSFAASSANYRIPSPATYLDSKPNQQLITTRNNVHENDVVDTADESDVVSIKPSKSRSGNTFTVKKDGVPMTSL